MARFLPATALSEREGLAVSKMVKIAVMMVTMVLAAMTVMIC